MCSAWTIYLFILGGISSIEAERPFVRCLRYPVRFADPCFYKNLTVHDEDGRMIVNETTCGGTAKASLYNLDKPPVLAFANILWSKVNRDTTYLVVILDKTTGTLIEMLTNVTTDWWEIGKVINPPTTTELYYLFGFRLPHRPGWAPPPPPKTWWHLRDYNRPMLEKQLIHEIHYLVFIQSHLELPYQPQGDDPTFDTPFDLHKWLNDLIKTGKLFCGPIAGAKVYLYNDTVIVDPPNSTLFPEHEPQDGPAHRTSCDAILLAVIVAAVLYWQTRQ